MKPFRKTFLWCCLLVLALPAVQVRAEWFSEDAQLMGTGVSVELWGEEEARSRQLIAAVLAEFQRLDLMMNPWNPASELARINREAGRAAVVTTPEILRVVERALYYSSLSEGAFDISFASVGQHYDYRQGRAPGDAVIARDRENIDYRAIELDLDAGSIRFAKPELQVDLGGIAKGYAVDRGIDILRRAGVESAVISAGGDSRILGDLGNRPRTIGIRHPRNRNEYAVMIPLADTAISTSGDYERFFMQGEVRVHHILDPGTGRSAQGLQSASVLAPLAVDSDALSTTVFVLGVERGLQLVNSLPGVDAILIDGSGKLHYSAELLLSTRP